MDADKISGSPVIYWRSRRTWIGSISVRESGFRHGQDIPLRQSLVSTLRMLPNVDRTVLFYQGIGVEADSVNHAHIGFERHDAEI